MQISTFNTPALFGDHHVTEVRRILLSLPGVTEVYASSAFQVVEVTYDERKDQRPGNRCQAGRGRLSRRMDSANRAGVVASLSRGGQKPFFRHTAVYETLKKTVSFAQRVDYQGTSTLALPGNGHY